jgi:signal transduction histidine kinase
MSATEKPTTKGGLKFWQKGLIIVLLPLVAESVFLLMLVNQLHQAEKDIRNEYHAKAVAQETSLLGNLVIEAAQQMVSSSVFKQGASSDQLDDVLKQLRRQVDNVKAIQPADDTEREYLNKISILADEGILYIAHARLRLNDLASGVFALQDRETGTHAQMIMNELKAQVQALNDYEKYSKKYDPEASERSRRTVIGFLAGGFVLNAFLALVLGAYFYKQFVQRVNAIVENSRRLVDYSSLAPVLAGRDEIAYVDEVLHESADKLREAAMKERALAKLKQEFVAMVSHDLRTPMTSIQGILTLLRVGALGPMPEKAVSRVSQALTSCARLIALINDLLDMEKLESGKMDMAFCEISAALAIEQAVLSVDAFAAKHGVSIITQETELDIYADEARLVQVLINLISNAVKYSPHGGTVNVDVIRVDRWLEFQVSDHGRGVPEELREAVFERFRQVEITDATKKGGTGLGLAICKTIVELHGGNIGVRDNEKNGVKEGSIFWFRIPAEAPPAASPNQVNLIG